MHQEKDAIDYNMVMNGAGINCGGGIDRCEQCQDGEAFRKGGGIGNGGDGLVS